MHRSRRIPFLPPAPLAPVLLTSVVLAFAGALAAQAAMPSFGHARARELAELGRLPSSRDIVVRDLINYHRHRLPLPKAGQDVALDVRFNRAAAAADEELWLQVGYTTASQGDRALAAPCAVALVVDCSGSMAEAGKMTQVQAGLRAFVDRLRDDDLVALVRFSNEAEVVAPCRRRGDGRWLQDAISRLQPDGSTNLHAGLMLGLQELAAAEPAPRSRRVVLLTDGIANRGVTEAGRMLDDVRPLTAQAIDISTIGVGQNLDVPLLQRLAEGARGLFHFVADATDVEKVFVDEADSLLTPVAREVQVRIEAGENLDLLQVYHEGARLHGRTIELALPDLNAGVTGVVLVRCRVASDRGEYPSARAELRATSAWTRTPLTVSNQASLRIGSSSYTIRPGDSLERIAREQLGSASRASEILRGNPALQPTRLMVGQRIQLPDNTPVDLEVSRNAAIAVLSQGLADMAGACDAKRWTDADRALRLAGDEARRTFPGEDADLQRVRDIVAGHQRTLARYVDRFRDL